MKSLLQLIHDYHSGVKNAGEEILKRMEPLIKSYASRIHCMERDDATQELYLTLLNTLPYLNGKKFFPEGECVRYMQTAIENRYRALCRYHLSEPEREDFDTCSLTLQADNPFDETLYDITTYIESFPVQSMEYKILSLFFYQYKTDSEIASILHVSRQYINRQKKKLLKTYFFQTS